jgi:hypothetical protein
MDIQGAPDWNRLTYDPQKLRHYPGEFEWRLVWEALSRNFGERTEWVLHDCTVLVLKPECFRRRASATVIDHLVRHGFSILDLEIRHMWSAEQHYIWRYQWNAATIDRLRLFAVKNQGESSVILLLRRSVDAHQGVPASVALSASKGSTAYLDRRRATDLRTMLEVPNRALTFIHCPDEPADVLRELVVLFPDTARLVRHLAAAHDATARIREQVLRFEATMPVHGLRYADVAAQRALAFDTGSRHALDDVRAHFGDLASDSERWDFITCAAELIQHDRSDEGPVISTRFLPAIQNRWLSAAATTTTNPAVSAA